MTRFKSFLVLFFLLLSFSSFSQSSYPLHPSIGDTLESVEKLDYSIFPFIPNPDFDFGVIVFENDAFYLNAFYRDSTKKYLLSKELIIEAQKNIEKINAYYRLKAKSDLVEETSNYNVDRPSGKAPVLYNKAMNDQINKEARMQMRIEEDYRRRQNIPGTPRNNLIFEFK